MLDDLKYIHQLDKSDALGFIKKQPAQLNDTFGLETHEKEIDSVVFCGMGGSSLVAELARTWPKLKVPFVVGKDYSVPEFVNEKTLVICASYSGNTEETIEALSRAQEKDAQIVVVAHGGKLVDIAEERGLPLARLREFPQPRTGIFSAYRALVEILIAFRLVSGEVAAELESLVPNLEAYVEDWVPEVAKSNNYAKQLALELAGKTPIIYAGPLMYPSAYKWKINANENAKNTAWSNETPEFNHNEMIGWTSHPVDKPFAVLDLLSSYEHPRVLKRFEVADRLLSGMRPKAITIEAKGNSALEHMLYLVLLGDYVTTYLAMLNNVDPTPVGLVEKFKKELQ